MRSFRSIPLCFTVLALTSVACSSEPTPPNPTGDAQARAETLYVAHEGSLVAYDVASGKELPGAVQDVKTPVDMQALDDGTLMVNLTDAAQVLVVDGATMLEKSRLPSSATGALRPVHSYISPERSGKRYWVTLNDGAEGKVETNSARFIDVAPASATYLKPVGEARLGVGHHKAAFSTKQERVVISNIGDCENVLSVYDYSNVADIKTLATLKATDAGYDGSTRAKTCDPTYAKGAPPSPHGCATSKVSGKAYCNLTSSGQIASIDIDATPPTFKLLATGGAGGGYTKATRDGRFVFSVAGEPREASTEKPGATCQTGQLVVIDATTDTIAKELPLFYKGPGCKDVLAGTDEATAEPSHMVLSLDGKTMFITTAGGFGEADARVRQELVVDVTNPAQPVQLASIPVGTSTGHHGDALSADGASLFVANNVDGTVTQIDVATRAVTKTITVKAKPLALATLGSAGPSEQSGPIH